jgi:uncharacterized protein
MQHPDAIQRAVAIAIHDVSPATWDECRTLLAMLDEAGAPPLSFLVVPHYHYRAPALADRAFVRAMDGRLARGDELVLHGCFHFDDAPAPRTARSWFERRVLTRSEGEFAALDARAAGWRLARGIALFRRLDWPLAGFVPPAWLMSDAARGAIADCGHAFEYVTVRDGIFHLPQWRFERTANLCYSPDTLARRAGSAWMIRRELELAREVPLLRISLHPQDVRTPVVLRHWRQLIADALASRTPVTKRQWAQCVRDREERSPPHAERRGMDVCAYASPAPAVS